MLVFSGAKLKYGTNDHGVMLFPTAWQVSKLKSPQSVDEVVVFSQHHAVCRVPNFEPFPCTSKAKIDTWQNPSWEIVETGSQTMPIFTIFFGLCAKSDLPTLRATSWTSPNNSQHCKASEYQTPTVGRNRFPSLGALKMIPDRLMLPSALVSVW